MADDKTARSKELLAVEFLSNAQPSPFDVSERKTFRPQPSALLAKLGAFLPAMEEANRKLEERVARGEDVNVENVAEGEEHVCMDVAVGPVEGRDDEGQLDREEEDVDSRV